MQNALIYTKCAAFTLFQSDAMEEKTFLYSKEPFVELKGSKGS